MSTERRIVTNYDPKPIPTRRFDWCATYDDYDAEFVDGRWRSSCPIGYGATEQDAITELKELTDGEEPAAEVQS